MKVVILAGGYGSRLSEETEIRPKPMVEIGGNPILWHIMKVYSHFGFYDFIILTGYKGYLIKDYFANYYLHHSDVTFELDKNTMEIHNNPSEPWRVTLLDTGLDTMIAGRIKQAQRYIPDGESFMLTYGDCLADVNITELLHFHQSTGKVMTMTSSQPEARFGVLDIINENQVAKFIEKQKGDGVWINAGFFVCNYKVFEYITEGDASMFERTLEKLARDEQLFTYKHYGFWHPMDTIWEKNNLNNLWNQGTAPWKLWK